MVGITREVSSRFISTFHGLNRTHCRFRCRQSNAVGFSKVWVPLETRGSLFCRTFLCHAPQLPARRGDGARELRNTKTFFCPEVGLSSCWSVL